MKYAGTRCARSPQTPSAPHFACHALCDMASTSAGVGFIAVSGSALTSTPSTRPPRAHLRRLVTLRADEAQAPRLPPSP